MTIFGWDASDYDWSSVRGPMDLRAARAAGLDFFTHKSTEGADVAHVRYGAALTRARDAGIPVLGSYHVVRTGDLAAELAWHLKVLDRDTPWWRSWPDWLCQIDLEKWSYDPVVASLGTDFARMLSAASGRTSVIYASRGQYGNTLGGLEPLWNANYPSSTSDTFRALYARVGGDGGPGWASYSNRTPVIWQYSSSAIIGLQHTCDANAFRGTLDQLKALLRGPNTKEGFPMALSDEQQNDLWIWAAGDHDPGTPASGRTDDRFHFPPMLASLKADVKAIKADVEAIKTDVEASKPIAIDASTLNEAVSAAVKAALTELKGSITFS